MLKQIDSESSARGAALEEDIRTVYAIAAGNVRIDGKPTQRHIAYLGGITDSAIRILHQRYYFWRKIEDELKRLGSRIGKEDRHRIAQALARKVQRPSKAEGEQVKRRWRQPDRLPDTAGMAKRSSHREPAPPLLLPHQLSRLSAKS